MVDMDQSQTDDRRVRRRSFIARMGALIGGSLAMCRSGVSALTEVPEDRRMDFPTDLNITRVTDVTIVGDRPKMIGKNAVRGDHGQQGRERLVRLYTDDSHTGFGVGRPEEETLQALVGKNPLDFFDPAVGVRDAAGVTGIKGVEFALWDLIARVLGKPICELIAGPGSAGEPGTRVPA